ncbi:hypothetical protein ACLOJK_025247 [Asimina triloba]
MFEMRRSGSSRDILSSDGKQMMQLWERPNARQTTMGMTVEVTNARRSEDKREDDGDRRRSMGLGKEGVGKNRGRSMGFWKNVGVEKKEGIGKKKERVERSMGFWKKVGVEKNEGIGKKKERVESSMGFRKKVGVEKKEAIGKKKERVEKKEGARKKKKWVGKNDGAGEERLIAGTKPSDRKGERMRRREREMGEGGEPRLRRTSQHPSLLPA